MKKYNPLKTLLLIVIILFMFIIGFFCIHKIRLRIEAKEYPVIGKIVNVNGHSMHVYFEGEGQDTLVFLSGSGTAAPALDFKTLYSKLIGDHHIAVVERAGYGFSETANVSRDIDTVLEETRTALTLAGESGPYILFPHSLSGIEALYWAQKYPEEIKAIVGLDAAVPPFYLSLDKEALTEAANHMAKNSALYQAGFVRLQPSTYNTDPAFTGDVLSDDEKQMYKALVMRSYMTSCMVEEARYAYANAEIVNALEKPVQIPILYFISNESEVGKGWRDTVTNYIASFNNGNYIFLDCGHYVHDEMPDVIARESLLFIESLPQ